MAGVLGETLGLPDKFLKPVEGLASELHDLRERWDNRLVLERRSLAEFYLGGDLEVVLYGDWPRRPEEYMWALRTKVDLAVLENAGSHRRVEVPQLNKGDDRHEVVVLVVLVEGVEVPKMLVRTI